MLGRKLIVIAAAVALALTHVTDAKNHAKTHAKTHVKTHGATGKVTVHRTKRHVSGLKVAFHKDHEDNATATEDGDVHGAEGDEETIELCLPSWTEVSVEGVEGVFCAKDQICVADIKDGACPEAQHDLPYGAFCDKVKTGVYGCKPKTKEMVEESGAAPLCTGEGESPMSVEGVEGVFCVKGQACVADIKDGACPGPQHGLEFGAECGKVKTGVYGCKPKSAASDHHEEEERDNDDDSEDDSEEDDSEEDAPVGNPALCTGQGESPMSVEGVEGIFCVTGQACVADIKDGACPGKQEGLPNGAVCGKVKTGVYGCKPADAASDHHEEEERDNDDDDDSESESDDGKCGEGESPMSVEGVEGIFCVTGQSCVADIKDGSCPGPQAGLEHGAECGIVQSGVYGCKPKSAAPADDSDDSDECGEGESPMSVEGVEGIFCVKGQACVADIKDGACPGPQEGLEHGAECGVVQSGVYGCKPKAAKRHRKNANKKGHAIKVVKAHAHKKVAHKKVSHKKVSQKKH